MTKSIGITELLENIQRLAEKEIPKKPFHSLLNYKFICSRCRGDITSIYKYIAYDYCPFCGQKFR